MTESWKQYYVEGLIEKRSFLVSKNGLVKKMYIDKNKYKILIGTINNGYRVVSIKKNNGEKIAKYIHEMIAETYLPKPSNKEFVIHIDHNKLNNKLSNLKWANFEEWKEYNKDLFNKLTKKNPNLNNIPNNIIKEIEAIKLKNNLLNPNRKVKISTIAKEFHISQGQVYKISRSENYSDIEVKKTN